MPETFIVTRAIAKYSLCCLAVSTALLTMSVSAQAPAEPIAANSTPAKQTPAKEKASKQRPTPFTPSDSLARISVAEDLQVSLAAWEPLVQEPIMLRFDGQGRAYVVERIAELNPLKDSLPRGRIRRLEDSDADGVFDSAVLFADNLALPRMMQPLNSGELLIGETGSHAMVLLKDADADGQAEIRRVVYQPQPTPPLDKESKQASGLIYAIDNWLYAANSHLRYRIVGGELKAEEFTPASSQWGLSQDRDGRLFFSSGAKNAALLSHFQFAPSYGNISVDGEFSQGFQQLFPVADRTDDETPGVTFSHRVGLSSYYSKVMPKLNGSVFIADPENNTVRRAAIQRNQGFTQLSNPYQAERTEFLRSADPLFRPVWTAPAPDGSLIVVDLYRGLVPDSYRNHFADSKLSSAEQKYMRSINGKGRLYRIGPNKPAKPSEVNLYTATLEQLTRLLGHENFWWRINAQKQIVLMQNIGIVPALKAMVGRNSNADARLHALWALEGLGVVDKELLISAFADTDQRVQIAAVRISERLYTEDDTSIAKAWLALASESSIELAQQIWLSSHFVGVEHSDIKAIKREIFALHASAKGLNAIESRLKSLRQEQAEYQRTVAYQEQVAEGLVRGEAHYQSYCATCHGADGTGVENDYGEMLAPPLLDSGRVSGNLAVLGRIVLFGLAGPVDGNEYVAKMKAHATTTDSAYIAEVLTYIREYFGNQASPVSIATIDKLKQQEALRSKPWTLGELMLRFARPMANKQQWILSSSHGAKSDLAHIVDGAVTEKRWTSGDRQMPGMWLKIELPQPSYVSEIRMDSSFSPMDYARGYEVKFSDDGISWRSVDQNRKASSILVSDTMIEPTKFIKITVLNPSTGKWWSINEIDLYGSVYIDPASHSVDPSRKPKPGAQTAQ